MAGAGDRLPTHRASDLDREGVVERLREATAEGRLDLTEFEERMAAAYRARTYGELAPLTEDLPVPTAAPITASGAELKLRAVWSSLVRQGHWAVPARLLVEARWGSAVIDLTEAEIRQPIVELVLDSSASSITIVVPTDTYVDTEELETSWGSSSNIKGGDPAAPRLRLRVTGSCRLSSLQIRHPSAWQRWRQRRRKAGRRGPLFAE
ncbi:MAG: DUF1707 domain-containing protein [Streptosporangiales bacterium]|nr:DUF1707 domain-containing protein [Streptosporangiales bacterium]